jgi:ribosome maturation factor RimP
MDEIAKVIALLTDPLKQSGYDLAEVKETRDSDGLTLHVIVDRVSPISLDDIVKVSDLVNPILDKADPIASPYTLDVTSVGAEKPIKLERLGDYLGRYVHLHLAHPYEGENIIEGTLLKADENLVIRIQVKSKFKELTFPVSYVDKARLAIEL